MRKFSLGLLLFSSILLISGKNQAEADNDTGLWFMGLAQGSFGNQNKKLSNFRWWFDGHARFLDDTNGFNVSIVRPGLGYAITERVTAWLGYAWILTSPEEGKDFDEHRIWQQLTWSTRFKPVTLSTRTRLEQRFVEDGDDVGWRFRQYFKLAYPFAFEPRLSLVGYDEVFLNFNSTDWGADSGLDQNRLFAGVGWSFDKNRRTTVEMGYLNQFIRNGSGDDTMNHILSINLLLNF